MKLFTFHSELFDVRTTVIERLSAHSIEWFTDYESVDLMHDLYGIEVMGIRSETILRRIHDLLMAHLRNMPHHFCFDNDQPHHRKWQVEFSKHPHESIES